MEQELDHFYVYGDVYEALSTCDTLEVLFKRLRRQQLVSESDCLQARKTTAQIRARLETILA